MSKDAQILIYIATIKTFQANFVEDHLSDAFNFHIHTIMNWCVHTLEKINL